MPGISRPVRPLFDEPVEERPLVDRASMLPIGQYADGSMTLAWPGMIKDTYDSLVNSYGDVAAGRTPRTQDVLNVASAPMMGNFAAKAAGIMPKVAAPVEAGPSSPMNYFNRGEVSLIPANRYKGEVFTGNNHGDAYEKSLQRYNVKDGEELSNRIADDSEMGFLTASGQFLSREEAGRRIYGQQAELGSENWDDVVALEAARRNSKTLFANAPEGSLLSLAQQYQDRDEKANGGGVAMDLPPLSRSEPIHVGPLKSDVAGRTDHLPISVPAGAYVLPADIVSALGEGNTSAGLKIVDQMFPHEAPVRQYASGGKVPIMAAGGEVVLSPEQVAAVGGGDLDAGHAALDEWVRMTRANTIETLKRLPGPAQD
jgi:hypothetical protein